MRQIRRRDTFFLCSPTLTGGNEDDVDAEDGVCEPSVEAVEAGHLQGGVEHASGGRDTRGGWKTAASQRAVRTAAGGWAGFHLMASSTDWPMMLDEGPGWERGVRLITHLTGL